MKYAILAIFFCATYTNSFSQNMCDECIKVSLKIPQTQVKLADIRDFIFKLEIKNCGDRNLKLKKPIIGYELDEDVFADVVIKTYEKGKYGNWELVNFYPGDPHYNLNRPTIALAKGKKTTLTIPFFSWCPIEERGSYEIQILYRVKMRNGYLVIPTEKVEIKVL